MRESGVVNELEQSPVELTDQGEQELTDVQRHQVAVHFGISEEGKSPAAIEREIEAAILNSENGSTIREKKKGLKKLRGATLLRVVTDLILSTMAAELPARAIVFGQDQQKIEQISQVDTTSEKKQEQEKIQERIIELAKSISKRFVKDKTIKDSENNKRWYFGNKGKYEIEFSDKGKKGFDDSDRFAVRYYDGDIRYGALVGGYGVQGYAFSRNKPEGKGEFEEITALEVKNKHGLIVGGNQQDLVYIKILSNQERLKIFEDVDSLK